MEPKEKAKELVDKFEAVDQCDEHYGDRYAPCEHQARKCALVCVEEIISLDVWFWQHNAEQGKLFWYQVKEEIEKL